MKTLIVVAAILSSTLFNNTYAGGDVNIDQELSQIIKIEKKKLSEENKEADFVKMSFRINEAGKVEVLEMNYSNASVKDELIKRLNEIKVKNKANPEEIYYYNFIFNKD